jgi:hypothetical protein
MNILSGYCCISVALHGVTANDELERMFEEATVAYFKINSSIFLEVLGENHENNVASLRTEIRN